MKPYGLKDNEEEEAVEDWLSKLSTSLVSDGKKSFLESISRCLSCEYHEMTKVCLITMVWFSFSLASLPDSELPLSDFSVLISKLKENLENSESLEQKILAATSLLNFSKIAGKHFFLYYIKILKVLNFYLMTAYEPLD